jgi:UDP-glucose 4-epimerase
LNLLDAALEGGVKKFVFSSTCATYGPPDRVPMTEDLPQRPINPYGESKLMFERILDWYHRIHGLEFVAFRYFNAAGASERFGEHHRVETHLIPNVLKVPLGQAKHCEIFGTDYPTPDGTCIRDYIHVVDLASAHIAAMEPGKQDSTISATAPVTRCAGDQSLRKSLRQAFSCPPTARQGDPPRLFSWQTRQSGVAGSEISQN